MMYCTNCGDKLPDDANFCSKCGKSKMSGHHSESLAEMAQQVAPPIRAESKWELCEIKYEEAGKSFWLQWPRFKLVAQAVGEHGLYIVANSPEFESGKHLPMPTDAPAVQALNTLVGFLQQQGWEHTGSGSAWFNLKFRRPVMNEDDQRQQMIAMLQEAVAKLSSGLRGSDRESYLRSGDLFAATKGFSAGPDKGVEGEFAVTRYPSRIRVRIGREEDVHQLATDRKLITRIIDKLLAQEHNVDEAL